MARLIAFYAAHEPDCVTKQLPGCGCEWEKITVDVSFDVPPKATLAEAITAARWAGMRAAEMILEG